MPRSTWLSKKDAKTNRDSKAEQVFALARAQLPPGILNCANDCFANSVLQSLIATQMLEAMIRFRNHAGMHTPGDPTLSPALTNGREAAGTHEKDWTQGLDISATFLQFMENAYRARGNSSAKPLNPRDIIRALGSKFDQYLDFRQQDAHELLRHLLDAMYMEEIDVAKRRQPPPNPNAQRRKARKQTGAEFSGPSPAASQSDVSLKAPRLVPFSSTVFGGRLASIIVCNTCKHISHTYEDFMDLSIPIKAEDLKKKSTLRAFAGRFTTSLGSQQPVPTRPTTPSPVTPDTILRVGSPQLLSNAPPTGDRDPDHTPQLGRGVSTKLNKSLERVDQVRTGISPRSRPTSVDAHPRASKPERRTTKPTPGEAAYLRALLRDEPSHINPLSILRGGGNPAISTGQQSNNHMWGRIGPTTTSLSDCLRMFTSVEILDGDNSFACHNCWKIANPGVKRRRKTRDKSPGSSSLSSSSSDEDSNVEPHGLLRPAFGALRSVSADAGISGTLPPGPPPVQRLTSLPSVRSPLFTPQNASGREGGVGLPPTTAPESASDAAPIPFPSVHVPTISTSLPSPVLTPQAEALSIENLISDMVSPVPRFRRFSSFHAETFLSPNVSRESLASAPPEGTLHRQLTAPESTAVSDTEDSTNEGEVDVQSTAPQSVVTSQTDLSLGANSNPEDKESSRRPAVLVPLSSLANEKSTKGFADLTSFRANAQSTGGGVSHVKRADQVILRHAFKRYLIDAPPPVLVIHLKRFQQLHRNGSTLFAGGAKKLEDYVSFPEFLDLRPFLAPRKEKYGLNDRGRTPRQFLDPRRGLGAKQGRYHHHRHHHWGWGDSGEDEEPSVMYRLYAVVVHIGSMLGGHYIAYTALPEPPVPDNNATEKNVESDNTPPTLSETPVVSASASASKPGIWERDGHNYDPNRQKSKRLAAPRQWCYVSDATVRLASLEEALKQKAYLLFYERMP